MRLTVLLFLLVCLNSWADEKLLIKGSATAWFVKSSKVEFLEESTSDGSFDLEASIYAQYQFSEFLSFKGLASTDADKIYFNADYLIPFDEWQYGFRLGRVNRNSGAHTNLGPSVDRMNYLPQGSNPQRQGSMFYRVDGLQAYVDFQPFKNHMVSATISYGAPVIRDTDGAWSPLFFAFHDRSTVEIEVKPVWFTDIIYSHDNVQIFADVFRFDARVTAEDTTGTIYTLPLDTHETLLTWKYGASVSFMRNFDVVYQRFFEDVTLKRTVFAGVPDSTLDGHSLLLNFCTGSHYSFYAGVSKANVEFENHEQTVAGFTSLGAPRWVLRSEEAFAGVRWEKDGYRAILEHRYVDGLLFLHARYENDRNLERYWSVFSASISYLF